MKKVERDWFEARHLSGNGRLAVTADALADMRSKIDAANEHSKAVGYEPSVYMIVHVEKRTWLDAAGMFVKSEEDARRVEIYPVEL